MQPQSVIPHKQVSGSNPRGPGNLINRPPTPPSPTPPPLPIRNQSLHAHSSPRSSPAMAVASHAPRPGLRWTGTGTKKPPVGVAFKRVFSTHVTSCCLIRQTVGKFYLASRYFCRGLPPNYRCRCCVSHPSSRWIGVVPQRYGHQDRSTALTIDLPFPGVIPENCIGYFKASCQQARPMASHAFVFPWESSDMLL